MSFASWEEALGALKQLPAGSKERADACAKVQGAAYWPKKRADGKPNQDIKNFFTYARAAAMRNSEV